MNRDTPNDVDLGAEDSTLFDTASRDQLTTTSSAGQTSPSVNERIGNEHVTALKAAHAYRRALVRWTLVTVAGLALAATTFMGLYTWSQWHHVEAAVIIAYFTAVVTETIGILYVIARYLFPSTGPTTHT